jgi:hypothetical protein
MAVPSLIRGWQLVAEALAAAGGHYHEGVFSIEHVLHDLFLITLEFSEPEELL